MRLTGYIIAATLITVSCEVTDPGPVSSPLKPIVSGNGLIIMNEGNYTRGNGSVSFFSSDSGKIYNNIFSAANNRSPGDIPFSIFLKGDTGYIVVNNSGKIEMVDIKTMKALKTITGLVSPRYIEEVRKGTGYISSLYSDKIQVIDLETGTLAGSIATGLNSEMISSTADKVYVASWSGQKTITIINSVTSEITGSITVTLEPESMVIDKSGRLWVLCSGGYLGEETPELIALNTATDQIICRFSFPVGSYPSSLAINSSGDTLYFLNNGVYRMKTSDCALPAVPVVPAAGRNFIRVVPSPSKGDIFVTDAADYQRKGYLLQYNSGGQLKGEWMAGIIPGNMTITYK